MRNNRSQAPFSTHDITSYPSYTPQPPQRRGICTAVIGSMTQAMRAQTVLGEAAIHATLTKISSSQAHNGCAYGVDYSCVQSGNVRAVLDRAGIRVRQYLSG